MTLDIHSSQLQFLISTALSSCDDLSIVIYVIEELRNLTFRHFDLTMADARHTQFRLKQIEYFNHALLFSSALALLLFILRWHSEKSKGKRRFDYFNRITKLQHQWILNQFSHPKKAVLAHLSITSNQGKINGTLHQKINSFHTFKSQRTTCFSKAHNPKSMIRISLVDDHKLFRSGIRALLSTNDTFQVVSESDNGKEFIEVVEQNQPDIVLMDLEMPEMDGMATTKYLKENFPDVKVIVLSMHNDEKFIVHLMEIGARGYLMKNAEPEDISNAILSVHETGYHFTDLVSRVMLRGLVKGEKVKPSFLPGNDLTTREIEVLQLICQENTAAEIGEKLFISPRTVEGHRNNLLIKTGARNIAGLVVFAMKNGFYE